MGCEKDGESVGFEEEMVRFGGYAWGLWDGCSGHVQTEVDDAHHVVVGEERVCSCKCDGNNLPFSSPGLLQRYPRCHDLFAPSSAMGIFHNPASSSTPYKDDTPLPDAVPKVQELGVSSAPLKTAAFFIGAYCKEYNGASQCALSRMRSEWMVAVTSVGVFRNG
jgi:hypothetical protein